MAKSVNQRLLEFVQSARGDMTNALIVSSGWNHPRKQDIERCLSHLDYLATLLIEDRAEIEKRGRR